jgi:hypothetical protein
MSFKQLFAPRDLNTPPSTAPRRCYADDITQRLQQTRLSPIKTPPRAFQGYPLHDSPLPSPPTTPRSKANQCQGTTTSGKRCTRIVGGAAASKTSPRKQQDSLALMDRHVVQLNRMLSRKGRQARPKQDSDTSEDEQEEQLVALPKFCHQHSQQAMEETGTFAGPRGIWVVYDGAHAS